MSQKGNHVNGGAGSRTPELSPRGLLLARPGRLRPRARTVRPRGHRRRRGGDGRCDSRTCRVDPQRSGPHGIPGPLRRHDGTGPQPGPHHPGLAGIPRTTGQAIGRPARGIGEPIWPGRRPEEILECQLHEALLNLAVDPELPFWLVCPYDSEHLDSEVIAEAGRSHPALATVASYHGSPSYRGQAHAQEMFTAELPALGGLPAETVCTNHKNLETTAEYVALQAAAADLWSHKIVRLTDAVRATHRQQPAPRRRSGAHSTLERARSAHLRRHRRHRDRRPADRTTRTATGRTRLPLVRQPHVRPRASPLQRGGTTIRLHMRK